MDTNISKEASYYIGHQTETTPSQGKLTLFVVGMRSVAEIEHFVEVAKEKHPNLNHIYFGALGSFYKKVGWNDMITEFLDKGMEVSFEYGVDCHSYLLGQLDDEVWGSRNFTPILNAKMPHLTKLNQNATMKIDDEEFNSTNDGVYCLPVREAMDSNRFTAWHEYGNVDILATKAELSMKRFNKKK